MTSSPFTQGAIPTLDPGMRCMVARRYADLSIAELADLTGLSRNTISNYENGKVAPRRAGMMAIAMATGVNFQWLETGKAPSEGGPGGGEVIAMVRHQGLEPRTRWFGGNSSSVA